MTRISKQGERRHRSSPRKKKIFGKKTGPVKDQLPAGYKVHANALSGNASSAAIFIPKIR